MKVRESPLREDRKHNQRDGKSNTIIEGRGFGYLGSLTVEPSAKIANTTNVMMYMNETRANGAGHPSVEFNSRPVTVFTNIPANVAKVLETAKSVAAADGATSNTFTKYPL